MVSRCLVPIQFEILGEVLGWTSQRTLFAPELILNLLRKQLEALLGEHEHECQKLVEGLPLFQLYVYLVFAEVIEDVGDKGSVVIRVIPGPRGQSNKVIAGIELQSLNVLFDNVQILRVFADVLDAKAALVIVLLSLRYLLVDHFEVFDFVQILFSLVVVAAVVFKAAAVSDFLCHHAGLKLFGDFEQLLGGVPVDDAVVIDEGFGLD